VGEATDHQVVEDADVEETQGFFEAPSDSPVGCARLGVARGVVVEQHHSRSVVMQGPLGDDPRVDLARVNGACEDMLSRQNLMARVEEDHSEDFMWKRGAPGLQVVDCTGRSGEAALPLQATFQDGRRGEQDALLVHRQLVLSPGVRRALHLLASTGAGCASWGPAGGAVR
jgi:hypothetical protein